MRMIYLSRYTGTIFVFYAAPQLNLALYDLLLTVPEVQWNRFEPPDFYNYRIGYRNLLLTLRRNQGMNLGKICSVGQCRVNSLPRILMTMAAELTDTTRYYVTQTRIGPSREQQTDSWSCILRLYRRMNFGMECCIIGINKAQLYWQVYWVQWFTFIGSPSRNVNYQRNSDGSKESRCRWYCSSLGLVGCSPLN